MPFSAFDIGDGDLRIGELSEEVGAHFSIWPIGYISPTDKNINAEMPFQPTRRTENYHEDDVYTNFSRLQSVYFYALNYPDKSDSEIAPWPKVFSSVYPENYYEGFADPVRRARDKYKNSKIDNKLVCEGNYPYGPKIFTFASGGCKVIDDKINKKCYNVRDIGNDPWKQEVVPPIDKDTLLSYVRNLEQQTPYNDLRSSQRALRGKLKSMNCGYGIQFPFLLSNGIYIGLSESLLELYVKKTTDNYYKCGNADVIEQDIVNLISSIKLINPEDSSYIDSILFSTSSNKELAILDYLRGKAVDNNDLLIDLDLVASQPFPKIKEILKYLFILLKTEDLSIYNTKYSMAYLDHLTHLANQAGAPVNTLVCQTANILNNTTLQLIKNGYGNNCYTTFGTVDRDLNLNRLINFPTQRYRLNFGPNLGQIYSDIIVGYDHSIYYGPVPDDDFISPYNTEDFIRWIEEGENVPSPGYAYDFGKAGTESGPNSEYPGGTLTQGPFYITKDRYDAWIEFAKRYLFSPKELVATSIAVKKGFKIILYEKPCFKGCKLEFKGPIILNGHKDGYDVWKKDGWYKFYDHQLFTGSVKVLKDD